MGMFGESRRQVFKPSVYYPVRRNRRLPRWLALLGIGIALGAGGVLFLQTNYGPARLSTEQSEQVRGELNSAILERQRLQAQIEDLRRQLDAARAAQTQPAAPSQTSIAPQIMPVAPPAAMAQPNTPAQPSLPALPTKPATTTLPELLTTPVSPTMPTSPYAPALLPPAPVLPASPATPAVTQTEPTVTPPAQPATRRPAETPRRNRDEPRSELRMTIVPAQQ